MSHFDAPLQADLFVATKFLIRSVESGNKEEIRLAVHHAEMVCERINKNMQERPKYPNMWSKDEDICGKHRIPRTFIGWSDQWQQNTYRCDLCLEENRPPPQPSIADDLKADQDRRPANQAKNKS